MDEDVAMNANGRQQEAILSTPWQSVATGTAGAMWFEDGWRPASWSSLDWVYPSASAALCYCDCMRVYTTSTINCNCNSSGSTSISNRGSSGNRSLYATTRTTRMATTLTSDTGSGGRGVYATYLTVNTTTATTTTMMMSMSMSECFYYRSL